MLTLQMFERALYLSWLQYSFPGCTILRLHFLMLHISISCHVALIMSRYWLTLNDSLFSDTVLNVAQPNAEFFLSSCYVPFLENTFTFYVALIKDSVLYSLRKEFLYQLVRFVIIWYLCMFCSFLTDLTGSSKIKW